MKNYMPVKLTEALTARDTIARMRPDQVAYVKADSGHFYAHEDGSLYVEPDAKCYTLETVIDGPEGDYVAVQRLHGNAVLVNPADMHPLWPGARKVSAHLWPVAGWIEYDEDGVELTEAERTLPGADEA